MSAAVSRCNLGGMYVVYSKNSRSQTHVHKAHKRWSTAHPCVACIALLSSVSLVQTTSAWGLRVRKKQHSTRHPHPPAQPERPKLFPAQPPRAGDRRGIKAGDRSREGWMYQASRARRRSLAAGMTLALACRGAALITNSASAVVRARVAKAATPNPAVRLLSRRTALGVARRVGGSSPVHCANGGFHMMRRAVGGRVTMCSAAGASAVEVSAEGLELEASIKTKGDTIRELKAGGASKDDLKPHIEVRVFIARLLVDVEVAHMLTRWAQHRCSSCDTCRQTLLYV